MSKFTVIIKEEAQADLKKLLHNELMLTDDYCS